jgi:hypothetical protein
MAQRWWGAKRSLGWIPFKGTQLKRKTKCLRFAGKALRVFEQELLDGVKWKCGCFAQDALGDWWLCLPVEVQKAPCLANRYAVGIDLGLKSTVATSDGEKFKQGHFYRDVETKIAQAQRRGHKRQAKRMHRMSAMGWTPPPSNGIDVPKWKCQSNHLTENRSVHHGYYDGRHRSGEKRVTGACG